MTVTIYGRRNSSSVQLVMWAVNELGLPHERLDYGHGHTSTHTNEYLLKSPMGQVPVLEDGQVCLFESAAILRYLGAKYGDEIFWPPNVDKRGRLDSWAEWGKNTFTTAVLQIFVYDVRMSPESRDPNFLKNASEKVIRLAKILDAHVAKKPWIGGADFTFADIACGHILYRYFNLDWKQPDLPALAAYYSRIRERPAFKEHVMVSYEALRGSY